MKRFGPLLIILSLIVFACGKDDDDTSSDCSFEVPMVNIPCMADTVADTISGHTVTYHDPAQMVKKSEGNYINGVKDGFWKFYQPNGRLIREGNYTNGRLQGFWKTFFPSGNLRSEGHFDRCVKNGFWKFYHDAPNSVFLEGNLSNDVPDGKWQEYNTEGQVIKEYSCD